MISGDKITAAAINAAAIGNSVKDLNYSIFFVAWSNQIFSFSSVFSDFFDTLNDTH